MRAATLIQRRARELALALVMVSLLVATIGCSGDERAPEPAAPASANEVTGTLIAMKDDRPVDGGIDLTLETAPGVREIVRVPSGFIAGPRDSIQAMHQVVDASKLGDRLRARGTRDEDGALRAPAVNRVTRHPWRVAARAPRFLAGNRTILRQIACC